MLFLVLICVHLLLFKGESLKDTLQVVQHYCDILVVRHPNIGELQEAAQGLSIPVINAGDGGNEHPSQALIDLFTLQRRTSCVEGFNVAILGDLINTRTAQSFFKVMNFYGQRSIHLVIPEGCHVPDFIDHTHPELGGLHVHKSIDMLVQNEIPLDVIYLTRFQTERYPHLIEMSAPLMPGVPMKEVESPELIDKRMLYNQVCGVDMQILDKLEKSGYPASSS